MNKFSGVYTALVTPFHGGQVDFESLKKLIRFQLDAGIEGFVVNGTTGESPTLTEDERWAALAFVQSEVGNQVPIVMGTGTNSTAVTVEQTQKAERAGASAALVVVPYYNKPPQAGLIAHFREVARHSRLPLLLYNVPGRTVVGLELPSIVELSEISNIVGIKEASGDISFGKAILAAVKKDFLVSSGDDGTFLQLGREGAGGVISVLTHVIPGPCRKLMDQVRAGSDVIREFDQYQTLTQLLFQEANPIPVKTILHRLGIIRSDEVRLPLVSASEGLKKLILRELQKLGLQ